MTFLKPVNPSLRRTNAADVNRWTGIVPSFQCCAPCSDYMAGNIFAKVYRFSGFVFNYIMGKDAGDDEFKKLIMQSKNLNHFQRQNIRNFSDFNEMCLRGNVLISSIFVGELQCCRKCRRNLVLDANWETLTVYHSTRGTYIGCRLTKRCGNGRLYEHYGFRTESGLKMFGESLWNRKFLLSTEDTAVDMNVLKYFIYEFVMGYNNSMESNLKFILHFYLLKLWWKYIPVNVYSITVLQIDFTLELFIFRLCHN